MTAHIEDYMDGPTRLNADDPRLLDYIKNYFFLKPNHYEVRLVFDMYAISFPFLNFCATTLFFSWKAMEHF